MNFEMTTTTISSTDDSSASAAPLMNWNGRKQDSRLVGVNRSSALLTFFALLVSFIFLISSLVYVYQLKREWMGEITALRTEFESMKEKNKDYVHFSQAVRQRLATSDAANLDKGLLEMQSLCLNRTDAIASDVERLKHDYSQNLVLLQNEIGERRIGDSKNAMWTASQIRDLNKTSLKEREDLKKDVADCRDLQLNETKSSKRMMKDLRVEFANQLGNLTEQMYASEEDKTEDTMWIASQIQDLNKTYLKERVDIKEDVTECRDLQLNEIGRLELKLEDMWNSFSNHAVWIVSRIEDWNNTYLEQREDLQESIAECHELQLNNTETVKRKVGDLHLEFTHQYRNLTEQLFNSEEDTTKEIRRLEKKLEHMQKNDSRMVSQMQRWNNRYLKQREELRKDIAEDRERLLNESRKHKENFDSVEQSIKNHTARFESVIETLHDSYSSINSRMHDEFDRLNTSQHTLEFELLRLRSTVSQLAFQDEIEQLKTSQSVVKSNVATLLSETGPQQASATNFTRTLQSMQAAINYLTSTSKLSTILNNWKRFGSLFYKIFEEPANYQEAATTCRDYGGELAAKILRDAEAVGNIISSGYLTAGYVWVGYDDRQTEGIWRGSDGGSIDLTVTPWASRQPDNYEGNEDCLIALVSRNQFVLIDVGCGSSYQYLCEVDFR